MSPGTSLSFLSAPPNPPHLLLPFPLLSGFQVHSTPQASRPGTESLSPHVPRGSGPRRPLLGPPPALSQSFHPSPTSPSSLARSLAPFPPSLYSSSFPSSPGPRWATLGPRGPQAPWPGMRPSPARSPPLRSPFFSPSRAPRPAPAP